MPRYDFRCPHGHVTEHTCGMADVPSTITCRGVHHQLTIASAEVPIDDIGRALADVDGYHCTATADRIFHPPAAIHYFGPGFYSTDVKGRLERKRRKMPADDMPRGDSDTHALSRNW